MTLTDEECRKLDIKVKSNYDPFWLKHRLVVTLFPHEIGLISFDGGFNLNEIFTLHVYDHFIVEKDKDVIGVGAYCGFYSIKSILDGARFVFAFEPWKEAYKYLTLNSLNIGGRIITLPFAISNKTERIILNIAGNSPAASSTLEEFDYTAEAVMALPLDSLQDQYGCFDNVDIVKIDTEGNELDVLDGMMKIAKDIHPRIIVSAYHWEGEIEKSIEKLKELGYNDFYVSDDTNKLVFAKE